MYKFRASACIPLHITIFTPISIVDQLKALHEKYRTAATDKLQERKRSSFFVERQVTMPAAECQGVYWYQPNNSANTFVDWEVISESSVGDIFIHRYSGLYGKQQHNDVMADLLAHAPSMEFSLQISDTS